MCQQSVYIHQKRCDEGVVQGAESESGVASGKPLKLSWTEFILKRVGDSMTSEGLFSTQDFMEGQKISEILSRINESQMAHHPQSYTIY